MLARAVCVCEYVVGRRRKEGRGPSSGSASRRGGAALSLPPSPSLTPLRAASLFPSRQRVFLPRTAATGPSHFLTPSRACTRGHRKARLSLLFFRPSSSSSSPSPALVVRKECLPSRPSTRTLSARGRHRRWRSTWPRAAASPTSSAAILVSGRMISFGGGGGRALAQPTKRRRRPVDLRGPRRSRARPSARPWDVWL